MSTNPDRSSRSEGSHQPADANPAQPDVDQPSVDANPTEKAAESGLHRPDRSIALELDLEAEPASHADEIEQLDSLGLNIERLRASIETEALETLIFQVMSSAGMTSSGREPTTTLQPAFPAGPTETFPVGEAHGLTRRIRPTAPSMNQAPSPQVSFQTAHLGPPSSARYGERSQSVTTLGRQPVVSADSADISLLATTTPALSLRGFGSESSGIIERGSTAQRSIALGPLAGSQPSMDSMQESDRGLSSTISMLSSVQQRMLTSLGTVHLVPPIQVGVFLPSGSGRDPIGDVTSTHFRSQTTSSDTRSAVTSASMTGGE